MAEESVAEETAALEHETAETPQVERDGHGPGFVLGVVLGMVAGAAAATVFAPTSAGQITEEASLSSDDGGQGAAERQLPDTPMNRVRTLMARVRSRVREAAGEAREAAHEAEEHSRARYSELVHKDL